MPLSAFHATTATAEDLSRVSWSALDRALVAPGELVTAVACEPFTWLGRFQCAEDAAGSQGPAGGATVTVRRRSGGPALRISKGSVYVGLALASTNALVDCDARRLLNRHVRPLLRALTQMGALSHYFDRDWVAGGKERRPLAWIGFAHRVDTGRSLVEAVIAVHEPFGAPETHPSFGGKRGTTLGEISPRRAVPEEVARRVRDAYLAAYGSADGSADAAALNAALPVRTATVVEPSDGTPWTVLTSGAMGSVGARMDASGGLRIGGALFASEDALANFEKSLHPDAFDPPALLVGIKV